MLIRYTLLLRMHWLNDGGMDGTVVLYFCKTGRPWMISIIGFPKENIPIHGGLFFRTNHDCAVVDCYGFKWHTKDSRKRGFLTGKDYWTEWTAHRARNLSVGSREYLLLTEVHANASVILNCSKRKTSAADVCIFTIPIPFHLQR